ncbi:MAG: glucose 1-dehydrogenase [Anaerolineae bacterium]|nr:glucose 1-dehydrogenase [Anaerolineae bacterium]
MPTLQDKIVLITGAGSGIGRTTALACAAEGAQLFLADIDPAGGEETVRQVQAAGGVAQFMTVDVADAEQVAAMVQGAVTAYGRLDGAVNNAGIEGVHQPLVSYPDDVFDRVMRVNVRGVWLCLKAELSVMLSQGGGAIVNTSSVAGLIGAPMLSAYDASKHAVVGLTRTAAVEYAAYGMRINCVCPSFIRTPMVERFLAEAPDLARRLTRASPAGRMGQPDEVAQAIVWLLSDAASFVNGAALPVDGGLTAL